MADTDERAVKETRFDPRLEAIRGLAALMVAVGHALVVYPVQDFARTTTLALRTIFNGDSAVTMFFVLSGLVLGLGLQRMGRGNFRELSAFATRRVFRILPVLWVSIFAILVFLVLVRPWGGALSWFGHALSYRSSVLNPSVFPSADVILQNMLLLNSSMNLVTWTLGVEMLGSLLLALAHCARMRLPASGTWLLLAVAGFLALLGKWFLLLGWVKLEAMLRCEMLQFVYLFYLGYLLPILGPRCFAWCRDSSRSSALVLLGALLLLSSGAWFEDTYRLAAGLGAWMTLGILLHGFPIRSFRILDWPVVRFLGRISYSFYLLHDLVLIIGARIGAHFVFQGQIPAHPFVVNLILVLLSVPLAAGLASVTHRWIEMPFIRWGKTLAAKLIRGQRQGSSEISPVAVPGIEAASVGT